MMENLNFFAIFLKLSKASVAGWAREIPCTRAVSIVHHHFGRCKAAIAAGYHRNSCRKARQGRERRICRLHRTAPLHQAGTEPKGVRLDLSSRQQAPVVGVGVESPQLYACVDIINDSCSWGCLYTAHGVRIHRQLQQAYDTHACMVTTQGVLRSQTMTRARSRVFTMWYLRQRAKFLERSNSSSLALLFLGLV